MYPALTLEPVYHVDIVQTVASPYLPPPLHATTPVDAVPINAATVTSNVDAASIRAPYPTINPLLRSLTPMEQIPAPPPLHTEPPLIPLMVDGVVTPDGNILEDTEQWVEVDQHAVALEYNRMEGDVHERKTRTIVKVIVGSVAMVGAAAAGAALVGAAVGAVSGVVGATGIKSAAIATSVQFAGRMAAGTAIHQALSLPTNVADATVYGRPTIGMKLVNDVTNDDKKDSNGSTVSNGSTSVIKASVMTVNLGITGAIVGGMMGAGASALTGGLLPMSSAVSAGARIGAVGSVAMGAIDEAISVTHNSDPIVANNGGQLGTNSNIDDDDDHNNERLNAKLNGAGAPR
jgi:hypothetical protein